MDKLSLLHLIGVVAVFISLLLSFFLLTVNSANKTANRIFASFLITTAIDLSGFFLYEIYTSYPNLNMFRLSISFLNMPLFFLYISAVCYSNFKLTLKYLIHAIPFFLFNLILLKSFYLADSTDKDIFLLKFNQTPINLIFYVLKESQYILYIAAVFFILHKYKKIFLENYTETNSKTYQWIFQISLLSVFAHTIVILKDILGYSQYSQIFVLANIIVGSIALSVLCWFVLKAMYNPELFRRIDSNIPLVKEILKESENVTSKTAPAVDLDKERSSQISFLEKFMKDNEPFLEPSLTIQKLAEMTSIPVRELSVLINHHIGKHFFDFINEYRIKKAMEILKDPNKKDLTVLEILYEVGFNSKSSFNTAFRKYAKTTPTEFRNAVFSMK